MKSQGPAGPELEEKMFVSSRYRRRLIAVAALAIALPMTTNQLNAQDNNKSSTPVNEVDLWPGFSMGSGIAAESASKCQTFAPKSDSQATYFLRCQATDTRAGESKKKSHFRDLHFGESRDSR
jgi:hypothetical protein